MVLSPGCQQRVMRIGRASIMWGVLGEECSARRGDAPAEVANVLSEAEPRMIRF